jgi:hypothetical protein
MNNRTILGYTGIDHIKQSKNTNDFECIGTDHDLGKLTVEHDWVCLNVYTRPRGMLHLERIRRPWCVLTTEYSSCR